jgi:hypothetical protein
LLLPLPPPGARAGKQGAAVPPSLTAQLAAALDNAARLVQHLAFGNPDKKP